MFKDRTVRKYGHGSLQIVFAMFLLTLAHRSALSQISFSNEPSEPIRSSVIDWKSVTDPSLRFVTPKKIAMSAQSIQPAYQTAGNEFYIVFLASVGSQSPSDASLRRIYISARSGIRGKVSLAGGGWQQTFTTVAKGLIAIDLPAWAEMTSDETEVLLPKVFKVEAEDEIAVYGLSHKWLSTDGFLVLPVQALGRTYTVASTRNALDYLGGTVVPNAPGSVNPRSEFAIAATQDNTIVTMTLSADSYSKKYLRGVPYTFTMNKGEALQIMAHDTAQTGMLFGALSWIGPLASGVDCDLTGSQITSDKPIAVFSGHERAGVADSLEFAYANHPSVSRDHLIEQMPPQENWGSHFVIVPSGQDTYRMRPTTGDIVRVIGGTDSTLVKVNGLLKARVNKGAYLQFAVSKTSFIETSQPSLVVKYLRTALPDSAGPGDPDLTVVPPLENMSTFYSIPTIADGYDFTDHFVTVLVDSLALGSTTLNGVTLNPSIFSPVPGGRYYVTTLKTFAGYQRIESPLPCYAETYGYGVFDSYSFSGGGSFKYLHDLGAKDLNFGVVPIGNSRDSMTGVQSISVPLPLGDSITIYRYSWVSGDTTSFALLDTVTKPFTLLPGSSVNVKFKFHPTDLGVFSAKLHVWSSNTDDVFINVTGQAAPPLRNGIDVEPPIIDFGRLRVGKLKDTLLSIRNVGDVNLELYYPYYDSNLFGTGFSADHFTQSTTIPPGSNSRVEPVHFAPTNVQYYNGTIKIQNSTDSMPLIRVPVHGRGVNFQLGSAGFAFGKVRVGKSSDTARIGITNSGDDSTSIISISLLATGDQRDFAIAPDSLPPVQPKYWLLDTLNSQSNTKYFKAVFAPKLDIPNAIIDTGIRSAIVKIVTTDGNVYYDTLSGVGAEPWLITTTPVLDFGIIKDPLLSAPGTITLLDTLHNRGTFDGILDSLRNSQTTYFKIHASTVSVADYTPIAENANLPFAVDFNVLQIGDFIDTVFAHNDSRNLPLVILKAKVRAGIAPITPDTLGDISNCLPVDTTITIYNPYRVNVSISSFRFEGDTAGFTFPNSSFLHLPVFIDGGKFFNLHVRYRFPADSLNGSQTVKVIIDRPTGGDDLSFFSDTVLITLNRKTIVLNMRAVMPAYRPSAGDAPFQLPIHIVGDRFGKPELDNDTLKLVFSNKLIKPVGVNRAKSLTESTIANPIPPQPNPTWDEATSTYSIPCVGLHLSTDVSNNTLLLTLLCSTFLTKDTSITITPFVGYVDEPCAYRLSKDSTSLSYANECGDQTIRALLLSSGVPIHLNAPNPDPAGAGGTVTCTYYAAKELLLSWKVYDGSGILVLKASESPIPAGDGMISIPLKQITASGTHYLEVTVRDGGTGAQTTVSTKFTVIR